jgi:hypothetical protein
MVIELTVIILTGIISTLDVVVNLFGFCCSGRTKITTNCINYEHDEKPVPIISLSDENLDIINDRLDRRRSSI